jgi:hypothetical protein
MTVHWTYQSVAEHEGDLAQGDILSPTEELRALFRQSHPYFCNAQYLAFIVTTQTCDLVRRNGRTCKAHYVNLAAIHNLRAVLYDFLDRVCKQVCGMDSKRVYSSDSKGKAHDLLERIFNQNEQVFGLFYLHPDPDNTGIQNPSVALLRVTVAVRADEHYEVLRRARTGQLATEFRNKLGWLVGNLYSRIGTQDWSDHEEGEKQLNQMIKRFVNFEEYTWVDAANVKRAREEGVALDGLSVEEVTATLERYKPLPFKALIAREARRELAEMLPDVTRDVGIAFRDELSGRIHQVLHTTAELREAAAAFSASDGPLSSIEQELQRVVAMLMESVAEKLEHRLANNPIVCRATDRTLQ